MFIQQYAQQFLKKEPLIKVMTWINLVEDMPEKSSRCIPFEFEVKKDDLPEARSGGA